LEGPSRTNKRLQCTANDVSISEVKNISPTIACYGEPVSFLAQVCVHSTATIRYDIAVHFGLNGDSARTCNSRRDVSGTFSFILPTSHTDLSWGPGPFLNEDGDACGDITSDAALVCANVELTNIACIDSDGDGYLNIPWCTSWDNNDKEICTDIPDALPGTGSKCFCGDIQVALLVCDIGASLVKAPSSCESTNTGRSTTTFIGTPSGTGNLQCRYIVELDGVEQNIGSLGLFAPCTPDTEFSSVSLEALGLGVGTYDDTFEVDDDPADGQPDCPSIFSSTVSFVVTEISIETDAALFSHCQSGFDHQVRQAAS